MRFTALIVDDQPSEIRLIQNVLEARGFDTVSAASTTEATQLLYSTCPHLLIIDIVLGKEQNGLDWLKEVRSGPFKKISVIMMTSSKQTDDVRTALNLSIDDYIIKPADFNVLSKKLFKIAQRLETESIYRYRAATEKGHKVKVITPAYIMAISEQGLVLSSFLANNGPTDSITIQTNFFYNLGIATPRQITFLNKDGEPHQKYLGTPLRNYCLVKGWQEVDLQRIRKWTSDEKLKRSF
ncbi:MAG: hypothetical protein A2X86_13115 [Bdellovibrionales bacterium GWA2_49_15]|nr:MAG: hypothetical protein A2X86_13115 [Bdellovibrionales bacterium GWA2_49_15]HAZ13463.1 hypothetical protein [Bdellovibrionales bacterium]